jgi:hypothetical protein
MRLPVLLAVLAALTLPFAAPVGAQELAIERNTMIRLGDYDRFEVTGPRAANACAEACERDPRCAAWTYIKVVSQCRLKSDPGQAVANDCCDSGYRTKPRDTGTRQAKCTDYARAAVRANEENLARRCGLEGDLWTSDFKAHFSFCMRVPAAATVDDAALRASEIDRCAKVVTVAAGGYCDHFARVGAAQIASAKKANCGFASPRGFWDADEASLRRQCERNPKEAIEVVLPANEKQLAACFATAGRSERTCKDYAKAAVTQYQASLDNGCGFAESRRWSGSEARHYSVCLALSPAQRTVEADARASEVADCVRAAAGRRLCREYAATAVAQAVRSSNQKCDLKGLEWSRYDEDHFDFCMRQGIAATKAVTVAREQELQRCERRQTADNDECSRYANRAVKLNEINEQRNCGLRDRQLWSANYRYHYGYCLDSSFEDRQERQFQRRAAIRQCSQSRNFQIIFDF